MNDAVFLKNFVFNEFNYQKPHHTDNSHGVEHHFLGFMKHGSAVIVSQHLKIELKKGDMFYIPKGCRYHSYWKTSDDYVLLDSIGFLYFPSLSPDGYILQKINCDSRILQMFEPLSKDKTINTASIGRLYSLLGQLEGVLIKQSGERSDRIIERLILLMNEDHTCCISDYAEKCGVSEGLLYLYCKTKLKKTPNRLRQEIACRKAIELLCTTNFSVENICEKCGFSSTSYFRKVLASVSGKTPTEIRKNTHSI